MRPFGRIFLFFIVKIFPMSRSFDYHNLTSGELELLVFTDLNDTLLDRKYDFSPAGEALELLRERGIPLIITTSKTRGQAEIYRSRLGLQHPLIVENGAAVHFPAGSFPVGKLPSGCHFRGGEWVWELARGVEALIPELQDAARSVEAEIEMIFDMTISRIREITGMSEEESRLAKERSYIVYFLCSSGREQLIEELRRRGLKITWGSYFLHLGSTNDKGLAVQRLTSLYRNLGNHRLISAGFGDNMNDLGMFQNVSRGFLVEQPGGGYTPGIEGDNIERLEGVGPSGWNRGVKLLLNSIA